LLDFQKALRLANGRQRREIIDWSRDDPSFKSLASKNQFEALTLMYQATPPAPDAVPEKNGATEHSARSTPLTA
jgi:hypothetical protein